MKKSSQKFKQLQHERILETKPWLKSTGPKSQAGKEASKMNALKMNEELYLLLKEMKDFMKQQKELSIKLSLSLE